MEKLKFTLLTAAITLSMASCTGEQVATLGCEDCEERMAEYEKKMNDVIITLNRLLEAGAGDSEYRITRVDTLTTSPGGYIIRFLEGDSITILNGSPGSLINIGKNENDANYYWTLDGEWLRDSNGNRIAVSGIPPRVQINDDNIWEISTDGGKTWESTGVVAVGPQGPPGYGAGEPGNTSFQEYGVDTTASRYYVIFRLIVDGNEIEIRIPRHIEPIKITGPIDLTPLLASPIGNSAPMPSFTDTRLVGFVEWYEKNSNVPLQLNETFRFGAEYRARIKLRPLDGYTFPDKENTITVRHTHASTPNKTVEFQINEMKNDYEETVYRIAEGEITFTATQSNSNPVTDTDLTPRLQRPQEGLIPVTALPAGFDEYTGSVTWRNADQSPMTEPRFARNQVYIATVTLRAKPGFTFNGIPQNAFSHSYADSVANPQGTADTLIVHVRFPTTTVDVPVTDLNLTDRIPQPQDGQKPFTELKEGFQYTGTVTQWLEAGAGTTEFFMTKDTFERGKVYIAAVTLKAKPGFTFKGVTSNAFSHSHATTVTNNTSTADTLHIKIYFRKMAVYTPVTDLDLTLYVLKPVIWQKPKVSNTSNQYTFNVKWSSLNDDSTENELKPDSVFKVGLRYRATVSMEKRENFTFKEDDNPGAQLESVIFFHQEGFVTYADRYDPPAADWTGDSIMLTVDFDALDAPAVVTEFSGPNTTLSSVIDVIRETKGQDIRFIRINSPKTTEVVKFAAHGSRDFQFEGLVLKHDADTTSPSILTIDGNGLTVNIIENPPSGNPMITVGKGVTLTLQYITLKGIMHHDNGTTFNGDDEYNDNNAPLIKVTEGGNLILGTGAVITENYNNNSNSIGGGIVVEQGSTLTINAGAKISGNWSAADQPGGGVYAMNGKVIMKGGSIDDNRSRYDWGGDTHRSNGRGGGVYIGGPLGSFTLEGGNISNNHARADGGGVCVDGGAVFTITAGSGSISNNKANNGFAGGGGGVYVTGSGSRFIMKGGRISDNEIINGSNGGGVLVDNGATFTMEYGATVSGNKAPGYGGGVYVADGLFTMSDGSISGNNASNYYGAGVFVTPQSQFIKTGGVIYGAGNEANNAWEISTSQNYGGTSPVSGTFGYSNITGGGAGKGYAVFYGTTSAGSASPLYRDHTITKSLSTRDSIVEWTRQPPLQP